jgi:hypothetical protein
MALQFPLFLLSKLVTDMSLSMAAICLVPSSLLYGYAIAGLARRFRLRAENRKPAGRITTV